jgi:hypothetical protein
VDSEDSGRKEVTNMVSNRPVSATFRAGDEVVLAEGTYQGTVGVFVRFRKDPHWADISERDGSIRSHPVAWLEHESHPGLPALMPADSEVV